MRSSIANLKESLHKIAQDVHDDDEDELGIYSGRERRRLSHSLGHSPSSPNGSPLPNGFSSPPNPEIEQYKAEIKRLRESEAEIKALSVNYAALLKEKEDHITQLNQEFESLKQNLDTTKAALNVATNEPSRASSAGASTIKGRADQSPTQRNMSSPKNARHSGSQWANGSVSKQHGHSNGFAHSLGSEKELADLLEEKRESLAALQANHEQELKKLQAELEREHDKSKSIQLKLQEEQKKIHTFEQEFNSVKLGRDKDSEEISRLNKELSNRGEEIRLLQKEKGRKKDQEATDMGSMKRLVAELEQEKENLKNNHPSGTFPGKDELQNSVERLEKDLREARRERDKAAQELARLKQHLLDKESEESEKMDEDSKIIEELQQQVEYQRVAMLKMEKALNLAYVSQEETRSTSNTELQKYKEAVADLQEKLGACMRTIDAKNTELLNLETALGQYYAEVEAKERLENDLSVSREECSKLGQSLQDITNQFEVSKNEKEETIARLAQMENMVAEAKSRVNKLEEDNAKLRRALEQSMTRLNRMSVDSDFLVDRRIVIKLLVTYFQRNHSKEVLELMVRMLGFSDEDKQRIGVAQQGPGKGVVRNVLGFPGRFVGGMLSNSSNTNAAQANEHSDDQSFADLWVDFLLKESEEREKRESMEASVSSSSSSVAEQTQTTSASATTMASQPPDERAASNFGRPPPSVLTPNPPLPLGQAPRTLYSSYSGSSGGFQQLEYTGSEFSTVPLTPSHDSSWSSKLPPKY